MFRELGHLRAVDFSRGHECLKVFSLPLSLSLSGLAGAGEGWKHKLEHKGLAFLKTCSHFSEEF